jgi:hypothetical protein
MTGQSPHIIKLVSLIRDNAYRHDTWQIFRDFVGLSAISLSNAVDHGHREERENQYLEMIKRYDRQEINRFPQMLAALTMALEDEACDVLGRVFSELELGNKWAGQFFTPDCVCRMMAAMNFDDRAKAIIEDRGFIRVNEPAVGGGAMIIGLCNEMRAQGVNYQRHLHVTAVDVDIRAVHMAYVQLSLLHVPAVVIHGNTLSLEEYSHWYTPAHVMGGWTGKLGGVSRSSSPAGSRPVSTDTDEPSQLILL